MERYTYFDGGKWRMRVGDAEYSGKETERLAAYEETGLEPEEIRDSIGGISPICVQCDGKTSDGVVTEKCGYPDDITKCLEQSKHLCELAQAEKEGRLVVLPCDVGDKLYDVTLGEVREKIVISLSMLLSKSVNHLVIHAENFRNAVTSYELQDIGKTVFLTREAAEAALKEREADHDR